MWKRSANHKGKPILRCLSDVIPGRNNAGINLFCDNCVRLIALITVRTEPEASGNAFTFHQSVLAFHVKEAFKNNNNNNDCCATLLME